MDVLNRTLYRRLSMRFGGCRVSNRGERMLCQAIKSNTDEESPQLLIEHAGEYYQVCCPYCRDTRYRLYVNHRFGLLDAFGRRLLFLAICYNEGCLSSPDNFKDFLEQLDADAMAEAVLKKGVVVPEEAREVLPPGPTIRLRDLRRTHPARVYLTSRGFDPDGLCEKFGVSYCGKSRYGFARNRLIVPVVEGGKLKGWQARYIGELDWKGPRRKELPPKYFSSPGAHFRSRCILNFERMREWRTGVLVEGPTDVFRLGSMSGCIFGNSVTTHQRRKFVSVFKAGDRTGVLLLDPEEFDSKQSLDAVGFFTSQMPGRFCAVRLPDGTDPGSLDRDFLKAYVKERAAEQGVEVTYRKVK